MSVRWKSCATASRDSWVSVRCRGRWCLRRARVSASLPFSMASSRRSLENHWRILLRARGDCTNFSQSWDGPACSDLEVSTSTQSPCWSSEDSGTSLPLTRAPMVLCPTSVCTA